MSYQYSACPIYMLAFRLIYVDLEVSFDHQLSNLVCAMFVSTNRACNIVLVPDITLW